MSRVQIRNCVPWTLLTLVKWYLCKSLQMVLIQFTEGLFSISYYLWSRSRQLETLTAISSVRKMPLDTKWTVHSLPINLSEPYWMHIASFCLVSMPVSGWLSV